jgi:hypothetical protein
MWDGEFKSLLELPHHATVPKVELKLQPLLGATVGVLVGSGIPMFVFDIQTSHLTLPPFIASTFYPSRQLGFTLRFTDKG